MTVAFQTRTTVGQLVYRAAPPFDFGRLAADLDAALAGCGASRMGAALERDGMALLDHGASRVGVSLARELDCKGAAALIVTVGYGPEAEGDPSLAKRQTLLARLIAQRIAARFPPVETVWAETDEMATPDSLARLREGLVERRRRQAEERVQRSREREGLPRHGVEAADMQRMFSRLESALDARRMGRPELALAGGSARALEAERPARPASAPLRLAAHLIDATLMLVALPVGVAMMVYGLARGADLNTSARALAISGTTLGMLQLSGTGGALLRALTL